MKRLYLSTHEWILIEGSNAKIGISEYAQDSLGDIVFVDLPNVGEEIGKEESFGAVESVKSASELYMPLSGKIIAVNEELEDEPQLINEDALGTWIIEIELSDQAEIDELLSEEDYFNTLE